MKLKEFIVKELRMNGMKVGFESGKVVVNVQYIRLGSVNLRHLEWVLTVDYIETNLEHIHRHKSVIEVDMVTNQGKELKGMAQVTAIEEKVLTEITGVGELFGSGVK